MHITSTKRLLALCILLPLFLAGCSSLHGQPPLVSISDPAVYTSLHLYAANKHMKEKYLAKEPMTVKYAAKEHLEQSEDANGATSSSYLERIKYTGQEDDANSLFFPVMDDMARYFRQSSQDYEKNHLRMDAMLDDSQRITDALQVYESVTRLGLRYSPLGLQAAVEPPATGLIPSSSFASSAKTRAALMAAEQAQKDVKDKEAGLREAQANLAKAEKSHAEASDSLRRLTDTYEEKEQEVVELQTESDVMQLRLTDLQGRLTELKEELRDINGEGSEKNKDSQELTNLRTQIKNVKKEMSDTKDKKLRIDEQLTRAKGEAKGLKRQIDREKTEKNVKNAKAVIDAAQTNVNNAKAELSNAKTSAKGEQDKARTALAEEEPNHPLAVLRPKLVDLVADSPFDRLDRAYDFYNAYMLKCLRSFGDSRAIHPYLQAIDANDILTQLSGPNEVYVSNLSPQRLLLLAFQVHVDPGTRPNYMVGLRLTVMGGTDKNGSQVCANNVKIIELHPTRAYDIDDQLFLERINTALGASLSGSVAQTKVGAALDWEERKKSEVRRNFLSRISKTASFNDAGRHEYGWNFYPSNLELERKGPVQPLY